MTFLRRLIFAALVHGATTICAFAQPLLNEPAAAPPEPILYRQHLMSEELIAEQGKGYLPMPREKFEAAIRERSRSVPQATVARIDRATYTARLVSDELLSGEGNLELSRSGDSAAVVSLSPCGLAVGPPHWLGEEEAGVRAGLSSRGDYLAVVDRNGTMQFGWTLRGKSLNGREREFVLRFPRSPQNHVRLNLPAAAAMVPSQGVVQQIIDAPGDSSRKIWDLELGGHHEVTIRIEDQSKNLAKSIEAFIRESLTYHVATSGLEISANFRIDCPYRPVRRLILQADPLVLVSSAKIGDKPVSVVRRTTSGESSSDSNSATYELTFSEPLRGTDMELIVRAVTPTVTGKEWRLPRLRLTGVEWISGTTTIEVLSPLSLVSIKPQNGLERKVEPLPLPLRGELRECQCVSPDHGIDVQLEIASEELAAETATLLRFSETGVTGQIVADLRSVRGEPFELRAAIQPGWVIDSVQTDPPELLEGFQTEGGRQQTLRTRLRQAVRSDHVTRVTVRGRRSALPLDRTANVGTLQFVRWHNATLRNGIVAFVVEPPLRLSVAGDLDVPRIDNKALTPSETSRLSVPASAILFRDGPAANTMTVSLAATQPTYSAQIETDARVDSTSITQTFQMRILPERSHVGRVLVRFSKSSAEAPTWELLNSPDNSVSSRRLDVPESLGDYELWEVSLIRALNSPFTLKAVRKLAFNSEAALGLAAVPEAASQTGTLRVVSGDGTPLEINTSGLRAVGMVRPTGGDIPMLRGVYRYEPSQEVGVRLRRPVAKNTPILAWIWWADLTSRVGGEGEIRSELQLFIENNGLSSVALRIPKDAILLQATADGAHDEPEPQSQSGMVVIPLPKGVRFPVVEATFLTRREPFRLAAMVESIWPEADLPCLMRHWTVWTPPELHVAGMWNSLAQTATWDERLFGLPIVRRGARPFDPFSASQWQRMSSPLFSDHPREDSPSAANLDFRKMEGPWASSFEAGAEEASAGWHRYVTTVSGNDVPRVFVYAGSAVTSLAWGGVLAIAGILVLRAGSRKQWWFGIMGITAILLLLMPYELLPPLRGILYGSMLASALVLFSRRVPDKSTVMLSPSSTSSRGDLSMTLPAVALILFISAVLAARATAQPPVGAALPKSPKKSRVYPVLVPIDEAQQPTGDYVYIPEALFDELHRSTGEEDGSPFGPLLTAALYSIHIDSPQDMESAPQRAVTAEFDLDGISANCRLRLPLRREQARVVDARVDGVPVLYEWDEGGRSLTITIEQAESKQLQLILRPIAAGERGPGFSLSIPAVPHSRATITINPDIESVNVPTAVGSVLRTAPDIIAAELGPAESLQINWDKLRAADQNNADVAVEQLVWMRVQPNSVIVDAQFRLVGESGKLQYIDIEADPRLRLLPIASDPSVPVQEMQVGGIRILRCALTSLPDRQSTVSLSFALNGGGIGNLRVPRLSAVAKQRAPLWLGVTVADELSGQFATAANVTSLAPTEFTKSWNRGTEAPQMAVVVPAENDECYLAVRPRPKQVAAEQQVEMTLGHGQASIQYEGTFSVDQGASLQQRFHVPALFTPREVTVIHDDITRLLRWSRIDAQTIAVYFTSPLPGAFRIWIQGEMPLARTGQVDIPVVTARDVTTQKLDVRLFQLADVQAKFVGARGLVNEIMPSSEYRPARGRAVTSLRLDEVNFVAKPSVQLSLRPNRPRVHGAMLTVLDYRDSRWSWQSSMQLGVENGTVDTLRLRLPTELSDSIQIDPPLLRQQRDVPSENESEIVLRLSEPADKTISLRVSGRLSSKEGERVALPDISLLGFDDVQAFVALPRIVDRHPVAWDMTGLQSAEWPPQLEAATEDRTPYSVYQVIGTRMRAVLKGAERIGQAPQVHSADYRIQWYLDRHCQGFAAFNVEPSSLDSVKLAMPEGLNLLHVAVGGAWVVPRHLDGQTWSIPIALEHLPQRIEIVFYGKPAQIDSGPGVLSFPAPTLVDLPCAETFWSVEGPASVGSGTPILKHTRIDRRTITETRLEQSRSLLAAAESNASRDNSGDFEVWRSAWQDWVRQLQNDSGYALGETRLGSRRWMTLWNSQPRYDWAGPWSVPMYDHEVVHGHLLGQSSHFSVYYDGLTWFPLARQVGILALVVLGVLAVWRIVHFAAVRGTFRRYPHLAIGLFGIAWWLWLAPSGLGLAILGFGAALSLRPIWKTKPA